MWHYRDTKLAYVRITKAGGTCNQNFFVCIIICFLVFHGEE